MGGGHLHEITMFTTHPCACVHVHVCGGHPQLPPPPSTHPQELQEAENTKIQ